MMTWGAGVSGWVIVNVAPTTFTARDGMIVSTGKPTGTMRTERMYENFVLELEWRHMQKGGNAGVFIWGDPLTHVGQPFSRGIEVQGVEIVQQIDVSAVDQQDFGFRLWDKDKRRAAPPPLPPEDPEPAPPGAP